MAIECSPEAIASASECYNRISPGDMDAAMIYLLYVISGLDLTIEELVANSQCYAAKIDKQSQGAVIIFLLCAIADAVGA